MANHAKVLEVPETFTFSTDPQLEASVKDVVGLYLEPGLAERQSHDYRFAIITRQAIRRGSFTSVRQLVAAIRRFIDAYNERCQPSVWTKTADQILAEASRRTTSVTDHQP